MSGDVETLKKALRACEYEQETLRVALRSMARCAEERDALWKRLVEIDRAVNGVVTQSASLPDRVVRQVRDLVLERNLLRAVTLGTE